MTRQAKFLWMKDILEHLGQCYDQWQQADMQCEHYLAESMKRDLDEFRRVCDSLRTDVRSPAGHMANIPAAA